MHASCVVLAGFIAILAGIAAFVAVFFAPVVVYGNDSIMLAWGWVAPFVALPVGALVAWLTYRLLDNALQRSASAGPFGWVKAFALGALSLGGVLFIARSMQTAGDVDIAWSEEVRLNDGTQVLVKRHATGNVFGRSRSQPEGWLPSEYTIAISEASFSFAISFANCALALIPTPSSAGQRLLEQQLAPLGRAHRLCKVVHDGQAKSALCDVRARRRWLG